MAEQHYKNYYGFSKGKYTEGDTIEIANKDGKYKVVGVEDSSLTICPVEGRKTLWDKTEKLKPSSTIIVVRAAPKKNKAKTASSAPKHSSLAAKSYETASKPKKTNKTSSAPKQAKPASGGVNDISTLASQVQQGVKQVKNRIPGEAEKKTKQFFSKTNDVKDNVSSKTEEVKDNVSSKTAEIKETTKEKVSEFSEQVKLLKPKLEKKKNHASAEIKGKLDDNHQLEAVKLQYKRGKKRWKEIKLDLIENKFQTKLKLKKSGKYSFRVVSDDKDEKVVSKKKTARVKKK